MTPTAADRAAAERVNNLAARLEPEQTLQMPASVYCAALAAARAEERARCAGIAETYFQPCDEPADISARECGAQIAAALRGKEA
jgi:hypothetical protein